MPQLARIVVSYNDKVVAEPTLFECFNKLFGMNMSQEEVQTDDLMTYINRVIFSYSDVKNYSQTGDWESFGKAMSELDNNINNLQNKAMAQDIVEIQQ